MDRSEDDDPAGLPFMITPGRSERQLADWMGGDRRRVADLLTTHKALLFRGFSEQGGLEQASRLFFDKRLAYNYRSTPRTEVVQHVYTATEYPRQLTIPQHCENAYQRTWPMKLLFHCAEPAPSGGATPLTDMIAVTASIDAEVRREFGQKGVRYVRNYRAGVDIPWADVFGTSNKQEVSRYCAEHGMECVWTGDGLRTQQTCQALARHPTTGQEVWFNQAHLFHISSLEPAQQKMMVTFFGESGLPRAAYFGDGTSIDPEVLDHVRAAFRQHLRRFAWRGGDLLLIDNMLVSHGRDPYEGNRKVLVCMAEPYTLEGSTVFSTNGALLTLNV